MAIIVSEIKNKHSHLKKRDDGIVEIHCSDDFIYELKHVQENLAVLQTFAQQQPVSVINISKQNTSMSVEAISFTAKGAHASYVLAEAVVITSLTQKILGNFYLKINKPKVPTAFFNSLNEAEKWILLLKQKTTEG